MRQEHAGGGSSADPGAGRLDRALAEAVTLAVDDVLLGQLLEGLAGVPLASRLVLGASVYRVPVEEVALRWQVGEIPQLPGEEAKVFPEVAEPAGFAVAREALGRAGLLAPFVGNDEGQRRYSVHRWTAGALAKRAAEDDLSEAHRRAACYWRWLTKTVSGNLEVYLEARYHHRLAGELDAAVLVTEWVCSQLRAWGANRREEQLCREVLGWLPDRSAKAAVFLHGLGMVAQDRGSYDEALDWYRKALRINEELGNRAGIAISLGQMGVLFTERGAPEEAVPLNLRSLALRLELRVPQVGIDLHWLGRQRADLGEDRFRELVAESVGEESLESVLGMLDEHAASQDDASASGGTAARPGVKPE